MKILYVGRNCNVGGGTTFRYRASTGMIQRGHQVALLAQDGPMSARFQALGVRHYKVPVTPFNRPRLISVLRREKFDVVRAVNPTAGDDVVFARRFTPRKPALVLSIHGSLPEHVTGNECMRQAAKVIAFDQGAINRLRKMEWLKDRKINLVRRPVERRDKAAGPASPPKIVVVSRLSSSKGLVAVAALEAVAALQQEWPGLSLTIVGDGSMRGEIGRRAEELNRQHGRTVAVTAGMQVDPFPFMADASCVVGAAYVALEALFHEIPVVAAGFEGYGLVTLDNLDEAVDCNFGDTPEIHPDINADLFIQGFRQVLTMMATSEGREQYGLIRERLEQHHAIERVGEHLESIYNAAISAK